MIKSKQKIYVAAIAAAISSLLFSCVQAQRADETEQLQELAVTKIQFQDVSADVGLITGDHWKYGGPTIADLNNDGFYDLLLTNHNSTPAQLFMSEGGKSFREVKGQFPQADLHGLTAGDYDQDGDNDVVLSVGGGNGLKPQPQRLYRNEGGKFVEVTQQAGVSELGARGRTVRWIDLDSDGDLDFLQINAPKVINEEIPRNILFRNKGDGTFEYQASPLFEELDAERVLLSDFTNDGVLDLIAFDGHGKFTLLESHNDFSFSDVSQTWLSADLKDYNYVIAVAHADIDQDGDLDYYLARGKLHYGIANNSISYNKETLRLDLRDEGNQSEDGMELKASDTLELINFYHWPRGKLMDYMPIFLGAEKTRILPPENSLVVDKESAMGFPNQIKETGWYIGYMGNNKWKVCWKLTDNLAWDVRASFGGVTDYTTEFTPQDSNLPDVLLRNDGDKFTDISDTLPELVRHNNWGVTVGDFDNDSDEDFFVYRFGELRERVYDVLLVNDGTGKFSASLAKSATTGVGKDQHGDMGVAFDFDLDGKIDLLSGDDDNGPWNLYKNLTQNDNHYSIVHVGYSETGIDPYGAIIELQTSLGTQYRTIGSRNASHSQSLLNIAHFGLGEANSIEQLTVTWRDGTEVSMQNLPADSKHRVGR